MSDRFGQLYSLSLPAKGPMNWFTQFIMTSAKICIFHEWKILRTENCRKYDLLSIIAKNFLLGFTWSKQTKIAAVLTPCPHSTTPLTKNTCRYWILFDAQVDRITRRKTKPVTTTIILIRPLYWAGMSHMRLRPRCQGLEWLITLPSSLTSPPCSPPTQYWSNIPEITVSTDRPFLAHPLKLQKSSKADSSCVKMVMKRLLVKRQLIVLFSCDANVCLFLFVCSEWVCGAPFLLRTFML